MRTAPALIAVLIAAALLGGCAGDASAPSSAGSGSMGMGAGGESGGESGGMVAGAIAAEKNASINAKVFRSTGDTIFIPYVVAPVDGWLAVHSATGTGPVLGVGPVRRGENRDVAVSIKGGDSDQVRLALHVDRGARGKWDYDPTRASAAADRQVYVDRKPVEQLITLANYGVNSRPHEVSLWVDDQPVTAGKLRVRQALAPAGSWIAVNELENGVRGRLLGFTGISGEAFEIDVPVEKPTAGATLAITLVADRGASGSFEYSADAPLTSPDQVLKTGHDVVTRTIRVP